MLLKTLVENTSISSSFQHKHGICFYIEVENHKMLFDLGPNDLFIENAKKMNVDLKQIDTVIISHGHVDHAGALQSF
ncbi:MAG: MBL fold metallo-hydrolase [Coprobacillus cateniformis]|uniref:MBL fold metallo-hydrolase n=1 Tax=Longibaculum muris TaxID=1796628 RepID=UPI003AB678BD|nr:MBL fold metallo-hydrolase [Coprobacillus cateniformis]